jgi:short-subunit dehydrogenase
MSKPLDSEKWVLVTGASKGLGKELAVVFALGGYNLIINARDKNGLRQTHSLVSSLRRSCIVAAGDICKDTTINRLATLAKRYKISILVNNAGIGDSGPLKKMTGDQLKRVIFTDLTAPMLLTKKIYPFFSGNGKAGVIFINSLAGLNPQLFRSAYCAAKWGLRGFAKALQLESKKNNVRILSVYPSRIRTKPEFTYGMDTASVAKKIFAVYGRRKISELIIDGRPKGMR